MGSAALAAVVALPWQARWPEFLAWDKEVEKKGQFGLRLSRTYCLECHSVCDSNGFPISTDFPKLSDVFCFLCIDLQNPPFCSTVHDVAEDAGELPTPD